jgi:protein SCO1
MTNDQGANAKPGKGKRSKAGWGNGGWLILSCAALLTACSKQQTETPAPAPVAATSSNVTAESDRKIFQVRGVIQELKGWENEVVIRHEEIPNYMPAMTMSFEVKNPAELNGLATNDQVSFNMIVTDADGWIENIRKIGVDTNTAAKKERPALRVVREVEPLEVGDKMPDYSFTNSLGQKMSLKDFSGQAYAFTFIFTRCPFPTFCPRMNMNFAAAYEQLSQMPNGRTNWHLISISFDPDFDTPARLAQYSESYKPDPKKWSWVTGAMIDIDAIAEQVGLIFSYENNTFNHNLRTVVVDKNGIIRQNFRGNEWKPEDLVKEIVAGAEGKEVGQY